MVDASGSPVARGARWLTSIPATIAFCLVLWAVYVLELYVWQYAGAETFGTLFVARRAPSPGWLLAPLAHSPFDVWHLVSNLLQILAFGGIAERRLGRRDYAVVLVAAGLASTGAEVLTYAAAGSAAGGVGVFGASGVALALAGFVVVDSLRYRETTDRWHGETTWLWTTLAGLVVVNAVLEALVGAPGVAVTGHVAGIGFGATYALVRSRAAMLEGARRVQFDQ